jgi:hypothetical protein
VAGTQRALPQAHDQRTFWNHSSSPGNAVILRVGSTLNWRKPMIPNPVARFLALILSVSLTTAGCHYRVEIPREQLANHAMLPSKEGPYFVQSKQGGKSPEFSSIRVEDGTLIGELRYRSQGSQRTYALQDVKQVEKQQISAGGTVLGVLGIAIGAFALMIGAIALSLDSKDFGS